ncbi:MAG: hypothetical protein ACRBCL_16695 [Maritimibacter sp.]
MKTSLQLSLAMSLIAAATPALAGSQWAQSISRGMTVFSYAEDSYSITLACDPDRVFGDKSNATLPVQFAKHPAPAQVVLLAQSGEQAAFTVENGVVSEFKADEEQWAKMVAIIGEGGDYAFVTSQDSLQLSGMEPIPDMSC